MTVRRDDGSEIALTLTKATEDCGTDCTGRAQGELSGPNSFYKDRLQYIEDMVLELSEMAMEANCEALSGILDIAHREARLRRTE